MSLSLPINSLDDLECRRSRLGSTIRGEGLTLWGGVMTSGNGGGVCRTCKQPHFLGSAKQRKLLLASIEKKKNKMEASIQSIHDQTLNLVNLVPRVRLAGQSASELEESLAGVLYAISAGSQLCDFAHRPDSESLQLCAEASRHLALRGLGFRASPKLT